MIRPAEAPDTLPGGSVTAAHIDSLFLSFSGSPLAPELWLQETDGKITARIARHGGRIYLLCGRENPDEVKDFIEVLGYGEIFTEKEVADRLGLDILKEFDSLVLDAEKDTEKGDIPPLKVLYDRLMSGADGDIELPGFEDFAPDISHRLRHGGALAEVTSFGAGLVFLTTCGGIINGIAVEKDFRGQGLGRTLLDRLCRRTGGRIFAAATGDNTVFYKKCGFEPIGRAVIAR